MLLMTFVSLPVSSTHPLLSCLLLLCPTLLCFTSLLLPPASPFLIPRRLFRCVARVSSALRAVLLFPAVSFVSPLVRSRPFSLPLLSPYLLYFAVPC